MQLIDLFCGTGGFSLGAHRAGLKVVAAFDLDQILTSSYSANFSKTKLILRDVATIDGNELNGNFCDDLSGIFGGPPCQGFSAIGRQDKNDVRRKLLWHFFRVVNEALPPFFVMENVKGLIFPKSIDELNEAQNLVANSYRISMPLILDASKFGAATKRERLFIIGIRNDFNFSVNIEDFAKFNKKETSVADAISDLGQSSLLSDNKNDFDVWRIEDNAFISSYAKKMLSKNRKFTSHKATKHSEVVKKRFANTSQGSTDKIGRHPRLDLEGLCPTLRAGTGTDKGSYQSVRPIHPTLDRVITVREGARLQGFPDKHLFHPTIWHSFRMIGNSVSPIMSEVIFRVIKLKFKTHKNTTTSENNKCMA